MMEKHLTRRRVLTSTIVSLAGITSCQAKPPKKERISSFRFCLNTGTIRGYDLPLDQKLERIAAAGYRHIEPWMGEIRDFLNRGETLQTLARRMDDLGLRVESAISFPQWIVDDDIKRRAALEQMKQEMDLLAEIGGKRIAAPPSGATSGEKLDLNRIAERYRATLELGDRTGVVPQLELWGGSRNLSRLSEVMYVLLECGHPKACMIGDPFHMYKGGSDFQGLQKIDGTAMQVFHMNDYPPSPPRDQLKDADRIFPGDGIAPLAEILRGFRSHGGGQVLSLELFNPNYWKKDIDWVLKSGLEKLRSVADAAEKRTTTIRSSPLEHGITA